MACRGSDRRTLQSGRLIPCYVPPCSNPTRYWGPGPKATKAYISNLAVGNQLRRQGIGQALLVQAEQMAVRWGCDEIFLHV